MTRTLRSEGLVQQRMFRVEGQLVDHYNRALEHLIEKKTSLDTFTIDKRGESPEVEKELGKNYLQNSPSHRYIIIVSPSQRDAELYHEEFSFDDKMIDFLYQNFFSGIGVATRVDSLYGELDDGIRTYSSLEELLLLKKIHVELHTPSHFISTAKALQEQVQQLRADPEKIVGNDAAHLREILKLVERVGDVRDYNITDIETTKEIGSFSTRLFDGVYVFRDQDETVKIHRPGKKKKSRKNKATKSTVVIYNGNERYKQGPAVKFISMDSTGNVIDFLVDNEHARFSKDLIELRITQIEGYTLANNGYAVPDMSEEQRDRVLHEQEMPKEWHDLTRMQTQLSKGRTFSTVIKQSPIRVRRLLLQPIQNGHPIEITANLLTRLWPHDYQKMYQYNQRDLEHAFAKAQPRIQDYIVYVLKQEGQNAN